MFISDFEITKAPNLQILNNLNILKLPKTYQSPCTSVGAGHARDQPYAESFVFVFIFRSERRDSRDCARAQFLGL